MHVLFAVNRPAEWPMQIAGVEVVDARRYIEDQEFGKLRNTMVVNLCRSYSYQRLGYYVSLLAEARGHRVWPNVATMADLNSQIVTRSVSDELWSSMQRTLKSLKSDEFQLSMYFGQPLAKRHAGLARELAENFKAPLLRARFVRRDGEWELRHVGAIPIKEVPEVHLPFLVTAAETWLGRRRRGERKRRPWRAHLALLVDPTERTPPSNDRALRNFERVARKLDVRVERIERSDLARLETFDALFIRTTTNVGEYTYRFARRAAAGGLAVIDDPESILRCTNKVYLAELLARNGIPAPRTVIVHKGNRDRLASELGLPCVLKQPDGAFSSGVFKAMNEAELEAGLDKLLADSELVVAQEFVPTEFDWRVGVLGGEPLFACRYFMAPEHWQIIKRGATGKTTSGKVESVAIADAPKHVIRAAVRATRLIGRGLYGVDLKQHGRHARIIEVNDNPNIDGGFEDTVLGDELYARIVRHFLTEIDAKRAIHHARQ